MARYYMADEHRRAPEVQLASGRTWDALPEEYQQILQKCAGHRRNTSANSGAGKKLPRGKRRWLAGAGTAAAKEECRTSASWCSRCTGHYADYPPLVEEIQAE